MSLTIYQFQKQISKLSSADQKAILDRAVVVVKSPVVERCGFCGQIPLKQWRRSKKYCNNACKQKAWRSRKDGKQ